MSKPAMTVWAPAVGDGLPGHFVAGHQGRLRVDAGIGLVEQPDHLPVAHVGGASAHDDADDMCAAAHELETRLKPDITV